MLIVVNVVADWVVLGVVWTLEGYCKFNLNITELRYEEYKSHKPSAMKPTLYVTIPLSYQLPPSLLSWYHVCHEKQGSDTPYRMTSTCRMEKKISSFHHGQQPHRHRQSANTELNTTKWKSVKQWNATTCFSAVSEFDVGLGRCQACQVCLYRKALGVPNFR